MVVDESTYQPTGRISSPSLFSYAAGIVVYRSRPSAVLTSTEAREAVAKCTDIEKLEAVIEILDEYTISDYEANVLINAGYGSYVTPV